jgi:type IV pilus assembly protein PilM
VASKVTTLYINDTSIRLMVIRGKRIVKLADAPLDMGSSRVSDKVREAEIAAKIKQLFNTQKVRTKKVIVGLSGLHCLSRPVSLPQLPRAMLDEAISREAKRVLPVPPEQLYISWRIISATEGNMQAFMVAIPRQTADTLLKILHQMGLKPYLMDIKPLALARLVQEAAAIVVDVQSEEFDIVVMVDGVPQPIRTVPFPQEELSLPDKLLIVKDELKRTVEFYNSNNPEKPIQPDVPMYVSGELGEEPELYESLASELGYRVLPLSSPLKCSKQLDPAHYLVNIGLALKELRREAGPLLVNINTLPTPYQPKPISLTKLIAVPVAIVVIGFIALLVMTLQDAAAGIDAVYSQLEAANSIIEQRQSQKKGLVENIAALEEKIAGAEAVRNTFSAAFNRLGELGNMFNGDLVATVDNQVNGINLISINHSGNGLSISGEAPSELEILAYARNLDGSGRFSEVTVASIRRLEDSGGEMESEGEGMEGESVESGGMDFTLTLKLKETE